MVDLEKIKNNLIILNKLQPGLKVQRFISFPAPWISLEDPYFNDYVTKYGFPNHREIMKYEILIDVDSENVPEGIRHADLVEKRFKLYGVKYKRYLSGGDGVHFHLHINPSMMDELYKTHRQGEIRTEIIKNLVGDDLLRPEHIESHICLYNKTLVQIEAMDHRKGRVKTLVSKVDGINDISDKVVFNLKRVHEKKLRNKELVREYNINIPKPDCVKFFEGETINGLQITDIADGLYRIAFSLVNYHKFRNMKQMETLKIIKEWRDNLPEDWLKRSGRKVSNPNLTYMYKASDGSAGCNYRMAILDDIQCVKVCDNCPLSFRYNFDELKKTEGKTFVSRK